MPTKPTPYRKINKSYDHLMFEKKKNTSRPISRITSINSSSIHDRERYLFASICNIAFASVQTEISLLKYS